MYSIIYTYHEKSSFDYFILHFYFITDYQNYKWAISLNTML